MPSPLATRPKLPLRDPRPKPRAGGAGGVGGGVSQGKGWRRGDLGSAPQPGPRAPGNAEARDRSGNDGCPAPGLGASWALLSLGRGEMARPDPQPPPRPLHTGSALPGGQGVGGSGGRARLGPSFPREAAGRAALPAEEGTRADPKFGAAQPLGLSDLMGKKTPRSGQGVGRLGWGRCLGGAVSTIMPVCGEGCERDPGFQRAPPGSPRGRDILSPPNACRGSGCDSGKGDTPGCPSLPLLPGVCVWLRGSQGGL